MIYELLIVNIHFIFVCISYLSFSVKNTPVKTFCIKQNIVMAIEWMKLALNFIFLMKMSILSGLKNGTSFIAQYIWGNKPNRKKKTRLFA